ncbi:hypothetical protein MPL1032_170023 [Mesorhizobium plurifarium]|uniref:Uncharacterized protein n=1 Tax=Mesorhizobium plurifarium TaxID=69974 RepID=A0A0K2VT76_MESPL|nr:hypothetical protein MPL1032_170023 [Mesorhizobium plurifarium]
MQELPENHRFSSERAAAPSEPRGLTAKAQTVIQLRY